MSDGGAGREFVWDDPRPPRIEPSARRVRVELGGVCVADSARAHRALETGHPPVYYVPPEDVAEGAFVPAADPSVCEWKGTARYHTVRVRPRGAARRPKLPDTGAGLRPDRRPRGPLSGGDRVLPGRRAGAPPGGRFDGGWVTDEIVGPFKGGPGTGGW